MADQPALGTTLGRLSIDDVGVIFHNLHDLVGIHHVVLNDDGVVADAQLLWWNRAFELERLYRVEVGQSMLSTYVDPESALEHVHRAWVAGKSHQVFAPPVVTDVYRAMKPDRKLSVVWERVGSFVVEVATDISEARELSAALAHMGVALDEAIESRAKVVERGRIARDLHDSVIQNIYAASLQLNYLSDSSNIDGAAADEIRAVARTLGDVIAEIRTEILNFSDTTSEDLLPAVKRELMPLVGLGWMKIDFRIGISRISDHRLNRNVHLVIREAVTNALKHSNAQNVVVKVVERDNKVVVEVSDDGIGISPEVARVNGLANLKKRAEELNGQMSVHSETGKGATIVWSAPYRKEAA